MRQTMDAPIFEDPDWTIFSIRMKAKITQSTPSTWNGTLISMLSPIMGEVIYGIRQFIADLRETEKSWE